MFNQHRHFSMQGYSIESSLTYISRESVLMRPIRLCGMEVYHGWIFNAVIAH